MPNVDTSYVPEIEIGPIRIGPRHPPFVIAEIGINHDGEIEKAIQMVDDAKNSGCKCVKFQCHIVEDEMSLAALVHRSTPSYIARNMKIKNLQHISLSLLDTRGLIRGLASTNDLRPRVVLPVPEYNPD